MRLRTALCRSSHPPLWHALILFRLLPTGFRRANLGPYLAELSGRDPQTLGPGAITYQLRRLRLHGRIERLPNSYSCRVTQTGFRAVLFFSRTLQPPAPPRPRRRPSSLTRAFAHLEAHITAAIAELALAT